MADRLDRRVFRGRPNTVIGVPITQWVRAAAISWRFLPVLVVAIAAGLVVPAPFGEIVAVAVAAFYSQRVWWRLHDERRELLRNEILESQARRSVNSSQLRKQA